MLYTCEAGEKVPCSEQAAYRFLFPGYVEQKICESHALKARAVARAMSVELHGSYPEGLLIPGDFAYLIALDPVVTEADKVAVALIQAFRKKLRYDF